MRHEMNDYFTKELIYTTHHNKQLIFLQQPELFKDYIKIATKKYKNPYFFPLKNTIIRLKTNDPPKIYKNAQ